MTQYVGSQNSIYPYSAIVYIEATYLASGHTYSGSGVIVGENDVLTASHVVYEADEGGVADIITITPGKDGFSDPYGSFEYDLVNYFEVDNDSDGYIYAYESEYDIAILGLNEKIGDLTGWFSLDESFDAGNYHLTGYPGIYNDATGARMTDDYGYVTGYSSYDLLDIDSLEVNSGNSGGPVWTFEDGSPTVAGIVSTGAWAVDIGAQYTTLSNWITANNHLIDTSEPIGVDVDVNLDDFRDDSFTSGSLVIGETISGTIESRGDEDWFTVYLDDSIYYQVDLKGLSTSSGTLDDPYLAGIYDENLVLIDNSMNNNSGTGDNSSLIFMPEHSGLYYIAASAFDFGTGSYELQVQQIDDYASSVTTLGLLQVDEQISGEIDLVGDEDWFLMTLTAGEHYQIDLEGENTSQGTLPDPLIKGVYSVDHSAFIEDSFDDDSGLGNNSSLDLFPLRTGPYFIVVGSADDGLGSYTLSVSDTGGLILVGTSGADVLNGEDGNDTISGFGGDDNLNGGEGNDYLEGGFGDDTFDAAAALRGGDDIFVGGPGNDVFFLDRLTDTVVEEANEGDDIIWVDFSYSLADLNHVENMAAIVTGADLTLTGNSGANRLNGSLGDDHLNGGAGNDILMGDAGDDTFDWEQNQRTGSDVFYGGDGNDTYVFDDITDSAIEDINEGNDTIWVDFTYSLEGLQNIENLRVFETNSSVELTGNDLDNLISGSTGDDVLLGGNGDDRLTGGAGNDTFDWDPSLRAGDDVFIGGPGDDIYVFDSPADSVVELSNGGNDTIWVDFSFSLRGHGFIENLTALETEEDLVLTGHNSANKLIGSLGNDLLDGGPGDDFISGGGGDDKCIGGSGDDVIDGGSGLDSAMFEDEKSAYEIFSDGTENVVKHLESEDMDRLIDVERLSFSNLNLAFDLDGHAGQAAKLIGAVFGPDSVMKQDYVGIALDFLDRGGSYEELAQVAMSALDNPGPDSLVRTLWANLFDTEPNSADLNLVLSWLESGTSSAELIVLAADSEINQARIDLIGLTDNGLAYLPQWYSLN